MQKLKHIEINSMKSFLLDSISHEIRSPLNIIFGLTRLLKNETLSQDEYFHKVFQ